MKKILTFFVLCSFLSISIIGIESEVFAKQPPPIEMEEFVEIPQKVPLELQELFRSPLPDSDGDGMVDKWEDILKEYDKNDPNSFPKEPALFVPEKFPIPESGVEGAFIEVGFREIMVHWENGIDFRFGIHFSKDGETLRGGYEDGLKFLDYADRDLNGNELLTAQFTKYTSDWEIIQEMPEFPVDLSYYSDKSVPIGDQGNRVSFTFENFSPETEAYYRSYFTKLLPLLYHFLGPPAGSFNCKIINSGHSRANAGWNAIYTDDRKRPEDMVHEWVHIWKGWKFRFSRNSIGSGFEEGTASGMTPDIVKAYIECYPNDPASFDMFGFSMPETAYFDLYGSRPDLLGRFGDVSRIERRKYASAAKTFQDMLKERPDAYREIMRRYYEKINKSDLQWLPSQQYLINLWSQVVPMINGVPSKRYLESISVFRGELYNDGVNVAGIQYLRGLTGSQRFTASYAVNGVMNWVISKYVFQELPWWFPVFYRDYNYSWYPKTQSQPHTIKVYNNVGLVKEVKDVTGNSQEYGIEWSLVEDLARENFPTGLYRQEVIFDNFIDYDSNARGEFRFFGLKDLNQKDTELVIMIGVDGVKEGTVQIAIPGQEIQQQLIENGAAIFRFPSWVAGMEGKFPITVTGSDNTFNTYQRTLLEAVTSYGYRQYQFVIVDSDRNGEEDWLVEPGVSNKFPWALFIPAITAGSAH